MLFNVLSSLKNGHHVLRNIPLNKVSALRLASTYSYDTLKVETVSDYVVKVSLNRPEKHNAMSKTMWTEIGDVFTKLGDDPDCRTIVLTGIGKNFCSGIDIADFVELGSVVMGDEDVARKCVKLNATIKQFQDCFTTLEKCPKPIIAAVGGACVGGAVDLLAATDVRYCSHDAYFQVKEVDVGLAADVGTLQRLPRILGSQSLVTELCLSARRMHAAEAHTAGLVSRVLPDLAATVEVAVGLATTVAAKSPVAVQGTKMALIHARDNTVADGLAFVRLLNMSFLQSNDVQKSIMAQMSRGKETADFDKL